MKRQEEFLEDDRLDLNSIHSVLEGDRNAFRNIVDRYTPVLFTLAYRMLGDTHTAEEAVQDIFLRVYRSLHKYDQNRRFYTWMFTLAVNHIRSLLRSRGWKTNRVVLSFNESVFDEAVDRKTPDPENAFIQREADHAVHEALSLVPMKYREVFVLREVEELSTKETSSILGIPENTVKTWSRRAKGRLKKILSEREWN